MSSARQLNGGREEDRACPRVGIQLADVVLQRELFVNELHIEIGESRYYIELKLLGDGI
jgi:hypothetical protein